MLLSNPKQQRTLSEIVASLPDAVRAEAATRIARVNRLIASRQRQDSDLADALLRVLKSELGKELRDTIMEISTNA
jgi:hypothetical protein